MIIKIEKAQVDLLLTSFCQLLVEERQHHNLTETEQKAIGPFLDLKGEEITAEHVLSLSGYNDPQSQPTVPVNWH